MFDFTFIIPSTNLFVCADCVDQGQTQKNTHMIFDLHWLQIIISKIICHVSLEIALFWSIFSVQNMDILLILNFMF